MLALTDTPRDAIVSNPQPSQTLKPMEMSYEHHSYCP